jgi:hypothetical protein
MALEWEQGKSVTNPFEYKTDGSYLMVYTFDCCVLIIFVSSGYRVVRSLGAGPGGADRYPVR